MSSAPLIIPHPSPNKDDRPAPRIDSIILHYTGMPDTASALARLCDPAAKVSAHYLIDEDGETRQLVNDAQRAWHAGQSFWRGQTRLNDTLLGIELVNPGHEFGYRPFPPSQIAACVRLCRDLVAKHGIAPESILAHSDIAPDRKQDPGELFPWQELAQRGLGLWLPPPATHNKPVLANVLTQARACLRRIGYDCAATGDYDREFRLCLLAFQRHWHSENLSGLPDASTLARLDAYAAVRPEA